MYWNLTDIRNAFIGGLLIALASSLHLWLKGRVTGMSGVFNGLIKVDNTFFWKLNLFSGLVFSSCMSVVMLGSKVQDQVFDSFQSYGAGNSVLLLVLSGLLVGLGTKLGNGCTSGHGVCGLPRLSPRSLVAVPVFMATGFLMANLMYYVFPSKQEMVINYDPQAFINIFLAASVIIPLVSLAVVKKTQDQIADVLVSFVVGAIFGAGLLISGMTRRTKVLGFLTFNSNWDPALMFVMMGAILGNVAPFNYLIRNQKKPLFGTTMVAKNTGKIDFTLILGAALFGLGWGLGGVCPGPVLVGIPYYFPVLALYFVPAMAAGQYLGEFLLKPSKEKSVKLLNN
jgi:uncharacterized membrane protein YedE/YeeE